MDYNCFLVVEHSRESPDASYTLVNEETFRRVEAELDRDGWLETPVVPIIVLSEKAQFSSPNELIEFVKRMDLFIRNEIQCWNGE